MKKFELSSIDDNAIALIIRKLRLERSITQQTLAELAGVSFSFVNQVEGGKQTLRLDSLNQLLSVFGYEMRPTKMTERKFSESLKTEADRVTQIDRDSPAPRPSRPKDDWMFF